MLLRSPSIWSCSRATWLAMNSYVQHSPVSMVWVGSSGDWATLRISIVRWGFLWFWGVLCEFPALIDIYYLQLFPFFLHNFSKDLYYCLKLLPVVLGPWWPCSMALVFLFSLKLEAPRIQYECVCGIVGRIWHKVVQFVKNRADETIYQLVAAVVAELSVVVVMG